MCKVPLQFFFVKRHYKIFTFAIIKIIINLKSKCAALKYFFQLETVMSFVNCYKL